MNVTAPHQRKGNNGLGTGFLPSGQKPLPEPMFDNDNDNDNENMFITTDIYSISETNARHKYIGKSIKQ